MMNLKHFRPYVPEKSAYQNALYLRAESGEDWYECQAYFEEDTIKIAYQADGVIVSAGRDISAMFPTGLSVVEMAANDVPEIDDLIGGGWAFKDGEIVAVVPTNERYIANAEVQKKRLTSQCNDTIATLQDAVDLDMATDKEKASLLEWQKYRVLLMRVDASKAPGVEWPIPPEV